MDTTLHNAPLIDRLALDYEDLGAEIYAALKALPDIDITNDADMLVARDLVAPLKALQGRVATAFKAEKQPYLDGGRAVDNFFKALRVSLDATVATITEQASAYQARKIAEARVQASFLDEAPPLPAAAARVTDGATVAVSASTRWDFEITDIDAVPRELLQINAAAVKAKIAGLKVSMDIQSAADAIPGVRVFERVATTFR